ncbi:uncharacterized protein LOC127809639 [Diospyros lotus]|uniref:uncharacterized protein LOC127809639 n=1 Tax=Diospyros lotus TaxID=55363 RepID=UPI00225BF1A3|nr:uncharacterized protein LOC127809639 [Diospyros lotus]XP_052204562.1 uncharacterized protein LOC127809639 [Diospyros lotus]
MPREGSSSQNLLTPENNNNFSLSEACAEQSSLFKGAKLVECCSKDCNNSNNSHSDEQPIDAGSESDQKPKDEFSQPDFTHQDCDDDECYAEILKDDIVDLGKSLLPRTPDLIPVVADKSEDESWSQQQEQTIPPDVLPFQSQKHTLPIHSRARNRSLQTRSSYQNI